MLNPRQSMHVIVLDILIYTYGKEISYLLYKPYTYTQNGNSAKDIKFAITHCYCLSLSLTRGCKLVVCVSYYNVT